MWYTEMVVFRLLDFRGLYCNRTTGISELERSQVGERAEIETKAIRVACVAGISGHQLLVTSSTQQASLRVCRGATCGTNTAAKGFDRYASSDDTAEFAVVAYRVTPRARWVVGQLKSSAPDTGGQSHACI
jgi:hypothetical protein